MAKSEKVENKDTSVDKKVDKKSKKSSYSKKKKIKKNILNGIAYDNKDKRIFITGKLWPRIYEVIVHPLTEPIAPRINNFIVTTGSVKFTMRTSRGIWYQVEMSPNLTEKKWKPVGSSFLGTGHEKTLEVPSDIQGSDGYYRVAVSVLN